MEFSRQESWHGLPFSSPGDLPDPGIEPGSPTLQIFLYHVSHQRNPIYLCFGCFFFFFFFYFIFFGWALVRVGSSSLRREWTCPHPALEVQGPLDCQGSPDLCAFSHRKYFDLVLLFVNLPLEITSHLWSWGYRAGGSKTRMLCFGKIPVGSGSLNCFIWLVFKA